MNKSDKVEWHGHRGCRGLLPENSIPAFIKALDLGMDCLEMDVVISKDRKVLIAHEPYMPADICQKPDGSPISEEEEKSLNLFEMDLDEISAFNCGLKHPRFPEQESQAVHRPTLAELIEVSESHCIRTERKPTCYTIELKSHPDFDNIYHPEPEEFTTLVLEQIQKYDIGKRTVLQSFDFRILRAIRKIAPDIRISMLISEPFKLDESLDSLGFIPEIIGPRFDLVTSELISDCHMRNIRVVPWTINEVADMQRLIKMGVDGIITDYPNRKSQIVD